MDLKLPERTAIDIEWYDGVTLWIKTLNIWERDEACEAADLWAHGRMQPYRASGEGEAGEGAQRRGPDSGSPLHLLLVERLGAMSAEDQAVLLAEAGLLDGSLATLAAERWPDAGDVSRREAWIRAEYERTHRAALDLAPAARLARCCAEATNRRERNLRVGRLVCETLWHAVRFGGDHARRYWPDVDAVMELSDAERDYLWTVYERMQLPAAQVPISAAVSPA